jgi:hypothetical protein
MSSRLRREDKTMATRRGNVKEFDARVSAPIVGTVEDGLRLFIDHIEKCTAPPPASASAPKQDDDDGLSKADDIAALDRASKKLRPAFDQVFKWAIEPLKETKPSKAEYIAEQLWELLSATLIAGQCGTISKLSINAANTLIAKGNGRPPDLVGETIRNVLKEDVQATMGKIKVRVNKLRLKEPLKEGALKMRVSRERKAISGKK